MPEHTLFKFNAFEHVLSLLLARVCRSICSVHSAIKRRFSHQERWRIVGTRRGILYLKLCRSWLDG